MLYNIFFFAFHVVERRFFLYHVNVNATRKIARLVEWPAVGDYIEANVKIVDSFNPLTMCKVYRND